MTKPRVLAGAGAALLLIAATFVGGMFAGDDGAKVTSLQADLGDSRRDVQRLETANEDASDRLDAVTGESLRLADRNEKLKDRLKAELNITSLGGGQASGVAPDADLSIGAAASVGEYTLKPTAVEAVGDGRFQATITVKNDGTESDSPLCGAGATLVDQMGRSFDGDAVIGKGDACSDLQPGLTGTIYVNFTTPPDAEPAVLELQPDALGDGPSTSWGV